MRRRLVWLLGGWVVGTATAAWLRRRVRRGVRRYAPEYLRREVVDRASAVADGVRRISREVVAAGRDDARSGPAVQRPVDYRPAARRHRKPVGPPPRRP
jgi:hypothetical protein